MQNVYTAAFIVLRVAYGCMEFVYDRINMINMAYYYCIFSFVLTRNYACCYHKYVIDVDVNVKKEQKGVMYTYISVYVTNLMFA